MGLSCVVTCKGFSNEAAKKMAEELKIKAIKLSDMFMIVGPEELEVIVREAVKEIFDEYGLRPILLDEMTKTEQKLLEVIANSSSFEDVIKNANMPETSVGKMLGQLRRKGVLPKSGGNFETLKSRANRIRAFFKKEEKYKEIEKNLLEIMELLKDIKSRLSD